MMDTDGMFFRVATIETGEGCETYLHASLSHAVSGLVYNEARAKHVVS